jgi:uncharacterized protein YaiI (UPF0178 family)
MRTVYRPTFQRSAQSREHDGEKSGLYHLNMSRSPVIYIDADACPVKEEVYRVARRYSVSVVVVANSTMRIPNDPLVSLAVRAGFGAADDLIAETIQPGDIAITSDIPLAARCVARDAAVLDPKGRLLTESNIGEAVGIRDLMEGLRQSGGTTGGPAPMTPQDRSRFLSKLDELINAQKRRRQP